ncbi:type-2 restriction enzyme HindIII [Synergistales bacterium]|nr:type-2 restriction enzyme HindIII [Synergistales bacterium]
MFSSLLTEIEKVAQKDFISATKDLVSYIDNVDGFNDILEQIGTISESIDHDSTEEKLFAKASDAVLARAFREVGLKATVLTERGDAADVQAESPIYGYTLVADAKAFRMSRTAKNQKDFKVTALSGWRKDADYAVLCSPYFQYPKSQSQIYAQSIDHDVCLLSWEHLIFIVNNGLKESITLNLSPLWNFAKDYSHKVVAANRKRCFLDKFNELMFATIGRKETEFGKLLDVQIGKLKKRGSNEISYWNNERNNLRSLSRDEAIKELIKSKKIDEKIAQIEQFIRGLSCD